MYYVFLSVLEKIVEKCGKTLEQLMLTNYYNQKARYLPIRKCPFHKCHSGKVLQKSQKLVTFSMTDLYRVSVKNNC